MLLIIQIMFDIWNLTNKSVTNFLSIPSFKNEACYKLIPPIFKQNFPSSPYQVNFLKVPSPFRKGGLELWTKLTEAYLFAIKVNIHFTRSGIWQQALRCKLHFFHQKSHLIWHEILIQSGRLEHSKAGKSWIWDFVVSFAGRTYWESPPLPPVIKKGMRFSKIGKKWEGMWDFL